MVTFIKESYYILFNKNLVVILWIVKLQNYIPSMLGWKRSNLEEVRHMVRFIVTYMTTDKF